MSERCEQSSKSHGEKPAPRVVEDAGGTGVVTPGNPRAQSLFLRGAIFTLIVIGIVLTAWLVRSYVWWREHGGIFQDGYRNLSYGEYLELFPAVGNGPDSLDFVGASNIYVGGSQYIDGYDLYYKLTLSEADYLSLRQVLTTRMAKWAEANRLENPARKSALEANEPPGELFPPAEPPAWWQPPPASDSVIRTAWTLERDERGEGWYWIYNKATSELFMRRWNQQHFKL